MRKSENEVYLEKVLEGIKPLNKNAMQKTQERLDNLTKPPGSLGRMEELAIRLAGIYGDFFPVGTRKRVVVMAADHGVTKEGISAFPAEVTLQMLANFSSEGAAVNVLSRLAGAEVRVVDMGVFSQHDLPGVEKVRIRPGTDNFYHDPAMKREESVKAILAGIECARDAAQDGVGVLATGEMGIGNTTASSAVMAAVTGYESSLVVGRGTGIDDEKLKHKQEIVCSALKKHRPDSSDPVGIIAAVGGLELAGLTGLIIGAASMRIPVVVDGFISSVAALTALTLQPLAKDYIIPSHLSREAGHGLLMDYMRLEPYLIMDMRLGEGTGAVLAMQLLEAAARITVEMATFEEAGIRQDSENKAGCVGAEKV